MKTSLTSNQSAAVQTMPLFDILEGLKAGSFPSGAVLAPAELPDVEYRIAQDHHLEAKVYGEVVDLGCLVTPPAGSGARFEVLGPDRVQVTFPSGATETFRRCSRTAA